MIFTMDVGNTNIKTALFEETEMVKYWRVSTSKTYTSDEYGILLANLFAHEGVDMRDVSGVAISSVVPTINFTLEHMCKNYFGVTPMMVEPGIKTGINLKYENPRELGSDRIANAVAAYDQYGGPCIFIDFGTATTFGALDAKGNFLGGCICPGIKLASEALVGRTSKLPRFELIKPETVIGKTTVTNLQSGLIYGYIGQVDYLVKRMRAELNAPNAFVVATGGMAVLVAQDDKCIDKLDGLLTLKGLRILYERNH
ncbi:MAG TPA: type III pantothenate kinase [Candidatus Limiplasma sp.]|jgi:type III pantothenate kinase|nr:type III pantothenate kinase [Candidatus Limiplasma sp.]